MNQKTNILIQFKQWILSIVKCRYYGIYKDDKIFQENNQRYMRLYDSIINDK